MEIDKVRGLLKDVALAHSPIPADKAIQQIALALMHLAESVHKIEGAVLRPGPSRQSGVS